MNNKVTSRGWRPDRVDSPNTQFDLRPHLTSRLVLKEYSQARAWYSSIIVSIWIHILRVGGSDTLGRQPRLPFFLV